MLKTMRNSFHHLKWTLFVVIGVFVLGFVFFSGAGSSADPVGQVVAQVGSDRITAADFDRQYKAQVERYRQMYQGNFSPELERALDLPRNVLDSMIERILRLESARRFDLHVSDEELARKIVVLPYFQDQGQFIGREKYEKMLRGSGVAPERFEEDLREDLLLEKYGELVKASVVVPDADLLREFSVRNDKATIEYILVPATRLESNAQPSDADLQAYLDKHKDRYRIPVQRRAKYLLIDRAKLRAKIQPTAAEIQSEYEKSKDNFNVPEQVHASHILIAVKPEGGADAEAQARAKAEILAARAKMAGADFGKLANENTEDPSGKGSGGKLPPFSRGQMVPEFEEAAFAMAPGEIRGPVKSQFGFHVIKLESKTPARTRTLEEVRPSLSVKLADLQATREEERLASEMATRLKAMRSPSDDEMRKLQSDVVTYNTTEWAARGDSIPGIGANQKFSDEVWTLAIGKVSTTPISTQRGVAFVRPSEERAAGLPPFAELKPQLEKDWKAERREKDALAQLEPASHGRSRPARPSSRWPADTAPRSRRRPSSVPAARFPSSGPRPSWPRPSSRRRRARRARPWPCPTASSSFGSSPAPRATAPRSPRRKTSCATACAAKEAERLTRAYLQQMRAERKVEVNEPLLASFMKETAGGAEELGRHGHRFMIGRLTGRLATKSPDQVLLEVGGVGYLVRIPLSTFYELPDQESPASLWIHTHVREDALALYGFLTERERSLFLLLLGVTGIGPRVALTVLSGIPPAELIEALRKQDVRRLVAVPGVGKKTAERMVLELAEKAANLPGEEPSREPAADRRRRRHLGARQPGLPQGRGGEDRRRDQPRRRPGGIRRVPAARAETPDRAARRAGESGERFLTRAKPRLIPRTGRNAPTRGRSARS